MLSVEEEDGRVPAEDCGRPGLLLLLKERAEEDVENWITLALGWT